MFLLSLALVPSLFGQLASEVDGKKISITKDGEVIAIYRGNERLPCIFPLVGPTGTNVTRHYPFEKNVQGEATDHPHHVSFWMAHGSVNGHDFWHGKGCRIEHRKVISDEVSPDGAEVLFSVELAWLAGEKEVLREKRTYRFDFSSQEQTVLDTTSVLKAAGKAVNFGDTKEGTFAIRLTPTLRLKGEVAAGHIVDSEGRTDNDCWGKRSKWVAYHGTDSEGNALVVALMDHRENLRHPTWWHARDYGLLAANPFGQHDFEGKKKQPDLGDFTLEKGKNLTQRYRLVLQAGEVNAELLEGVWKAW